MAKTDPTKTEKVSLEDLLRVKRHERPNDADWERFDRELRAKPWQGLVSPPSAWRAWSVRLWDSFRPALPLGAAAAMALGLFVRPEFLAQSEQGTVPSPTTASPRLADKAAPVSALPEPSASLAMDADPHYVVGSFSASDVSSDAFTRVAATHYMPATQSDQLHYAYNTINRASHQSLSMGSGAVRSVY